MAAGGAAEEAAEATGMTTIRATRHRPDPAVAAEGATAAAGELAVPARPIQKAPLPAAQSPPILTPPLASPDAPAAQRMSRQRRAGKRQP